MKMMVERYEGENYFGEIGVSSEDETLLNSLGSFIDALGIAFYILLEFEANIE